MCLGKLLLRPTKVVLISTKDGVASTSFAVLRARLGEPSNHLGQVSTNVEATEVGLGQLGARSSPVWVGSKMDWCRASSAGLSRMWQLALAQSRFAKYARGTCLVQRSAGCRALSIVSVCRRVSSGHFGAAGCSTDFEATSEAASAKRLKSRKARIPRGPILFSCRGSVPRAAATCHGVHQESETVTCNVGACNAPCELAEWEEWGPCSKAPLRSRSRARVGERQASASHRLGALGRCAPGCHSCVLPPGNAYMIQCLSESLPQHSISDEGAPRWSDLRQQRSTWQHRSNSGQVRVELAPHRSMRPGGGRRWEVLGGDSSLRAFADTSSASSPRARASHAGFAPSPHSDKGSEPPPRQPMEEAASLGGRRCF